MSGRELSSRAEVAVAVALLAATAVLLWPAVQVDFIRDDPYVLHYNHRVQDLGRWTEWFTGSFWPPQVGMEYWRPLSLACFALNWAAAGDNPGPYHVVNIALHLACVALVWWTGRRLGLSAAGAGIGATLFAVHPVHVEVIAPVVFRTESLVAIPIMLALGIHLGRGDAAPGRWRIAAVVALHMVALGFKEGGLLLPVFLLMADLTVRRDRLAHPSARRRLALLMVIAAAVTVGYIALKFALFGRFSPSPETWGYPNASLGERLLIVPRVLAEFTRLSIWPMRFAADYRWPLPDPTAGRVLITSVVLLGAALAVLGAVALTWRRRPIIAFALLWAALAFAPYLNVVPFTAVFAERFLYLSSVGVCWIVGGLIDAAPERRRFPAMGVALLLAALWAGIAHRQMQAWVEPLRLWEASVELSPLSEQNWRGLSQARLAAGDARGAREAAREAVHLRPESVRSRMAWVWASRTLGDDADAERVLRESLEINPGDSLALSELALILMETDRAGEAAEIIERALPELGTISRVWFNLSVARAAAGDPRGALQALAEAEALGYHDAARVETLRRQIAADVLTTPVD